MSNSYHRQQPISRSFYAYGLDGIGTHRADERRAISRPHDPAAPKPAGTVATVRRKLGSLLVSAGERALGEPVAEPVGAS